MAPANMDFPTSFEKLLKKLKTLKNHFSEFRKWFYSVRIQETTVLKKSTLANIMLTHVWIRIKNNFLIFSPLTKLFEATKCKVRRKILFVILIQIAIPGICLVILVFYSQTFRSFKNMFVIKLKRAAYESHYTGTSLRY